MKTPEKPQRLGYMQLPKWRDTTWITRILALMLLAPVIYMLLVAVGDKTYFRIFFVAAILWIFLVSLIHKLTKPHLFKE